MPLDVEPCGLGNVVVIGTASSFARTVGPTLLVTVLPPAVIGRASEYGHISLRVPHFATCPDADAWRHLHEGGSE